MNWVRNVRCVPGLVQFFLGEIMVELRGIKRLKFVKLVPHFTIVVRVV